MGLMVFYDHLDLNQNKELTLMLVVALNILILPFRELIWLNEKLRDSYVGFLGLFNLFR